MSAFCFGDDDLGSAGALKIDDDDDGHEKYQNNYKKNNLHVNIEEEDAKKKPKSILKNSKLHQAQNKKRDIVSSTSMETEIEMSMDGPKRTPPQRKKVSFLASVGDGNVEIIL